MASAVNVTDSSAIQLGFLAYFVDSLGINKNTMLPESGCDLGYYLHDQI